VFQKDKLVDDCRIAVAEGQKAVRELVLEAVGDPAGIIKELGEPTEAGVYPIYNDDELTIINFIWAPYMTLMPHNHNMFAVIGLYGGREDNMFWRRVGDGGGSGDAPGIEAAGADSMGVGQVATMGKDIIHSVANPISKLTSAIHVYGGNFFEPPVPRSQWNHETLIQEPWDMDQTRATFREAGIRYDAGVAAGA
jgi:predicted metal-dependent enzyme (double-stranded beta helix superfamily)|tara:strand:- start:2200 stop:2784 length:585 start_codon:yes stop_codon:yes gene_type:complete